MATNTPNNKLKIAFQITGEGEKKFWTRVGVAFVNRDGSLNVKLDAFPINGEFHIRDHVPAEEREAARSSAGNSRNLPRGRS